MTTDQPVLLCQDLSRHYSQGSARIEVLNELALTVGRGERVAIVGTSGSGKTTLLNLLGGLDDV